MTNKVLFLNVFIFLNFIKEQVSLRRIFVMFITLLFSGCKSTKATLSPLFEKGEKFYVFCGFS